MALASVVLAIIMKRLATKMTPLTPEELLERTIFFSDRQIKA